VHIRPPPLMHRQSGKIDTGFGFTRNLHYL
jgi:hypothetical protein